MKVSLIPNFSLTGVKTLNCDSVSRVILVSLFVFHGSLSSDKR